MRKLFSSMIPFVGVALIVAGCAGPEQKLGRGINNLTEITRLGELRRAYEQTSVMEGTDLGYTRGVVRGIDRTAVRTVAGIYEVATFPFANYSPKNYGPIFTNTIKENPVNPDSYKPNWLSDQMTSPDNSLGFGGGDIMPFIPGSRFHVFDQ
jgi:putative exosortase-associated protein (TIGR04073 family)